MNSELSAIEEFIKRSPWTFARTMPHSPHEYIVKGKLPESDQKIFERFVLYIRERGTPKRYKKSKYVHFDIKGWSYWTMGAPLEQTIIINRHRLSFYDLAADSYDRIFSDVESQIENLRVLEMFEPYLAGRILDVGCGTGLLLDLTPHSRFHYLGVDPSEKMLDKLIEKHSFADTSQSTFEDFRPLEKYDFIASLFGAFSYVNPNAHRRVFEMLAPGGKYFLMFYKKNYFPQLYQKTGICFSHYISDVEQLMETFDRVFEYSNYLVATNIGECT